jgi:hypothetical protein
MNKYIILKWQDLNVDKRKVSKYWSYIDVKGEVHLGNVSKENNSFLPIVMLDGIITKQPTSSSFTQLKFLTVRLKIERWVD